MYSALDTDYLMPTSESFASILDMNGLNYRLDGHYIIVGELNVIQGWALHISSIKAQLSHLLCEIVRFIKNWNVPFRIPKSPKAAEAILAGAAGEHSAGKLISIYPSTEEQAKKIAFGLIRISFHFRGPIIPTGLHLGNNIYASFCCYNSNKAFNSYYWFPKGFVWPFTDFAIAPKHNLCCSVLRFFISVNNAFKSDNLIIKKYEMNRSRIIEIINALLVMLWVYAAVSKLLDYPNFKVQLGKSPLLTNYAELIAICLPIVELVVAVSFLIKRTVLFGLYASVFLLVTFSAYLIAILNFSFYIPCSCGGILKKMSWKTHIVFNLAFALIAVAGIILKTKNKNIAPPTNLVTA